MPSAKKVRWAQLKVGIMAAVALLLLAILVFLLTGERRFFAERVKIYTFLDDSYAITPGSPVRLNGILIGEIRTVMLSGETDPNRVIRVEMEVDRETLRGIPTDSIATVAALNVLGAKYINIKRGRAQTTVEPGGEIASLDTRGFEEVVASGYEVMTAVRGLVKRASDILDEVEGGRGSIGRLLKDEALYNNLNGTVAEARKLTEALNRGEGTIGKLLYDEGVYNDVRATVARVDRLIEEIESGQGTAGRFLKDPALYEELRSTVGEARKLMADLNDGKGTAGKLLKDEELHRQIARVVERLDQTLEKVNTGEGTLGQLLVNPQLYESLNGTTRQMQELMKDFRANPKKFLRIKLALF